MLSRRERERQNDGLPCGTPLHISPRFGGQSEQRKEQSVSPLAAVDWAAHAANRQAYHNRKKEFARNSLGLGNINIYSRAERLANNEAPYQDKFKNCLWGENEHAVHTNQSMSPCRQQNVFSNYA